VEKWAENLIKKHTEMKTITTAQAVAEALRKLKAKRIVVATPYVEGSQST